MPKTYNKIDPTMCQKIINAIYNERQTKAEVARRFDYPYSTIKGIADRFESDGSLDTKPRGGNRFAVLEEEHLEWIAQRLEERPDTPIKHIRREMIDHFQMVPAVSMSTVSRNIRNRIEFSLKLIRYEPVDYNSEQRIEDRYNWVRRLEDTNTLLTDCVFLDESGFNLHLTRRFGRARKGQQATIVRPTQRGRNVSLMVAVAREGIVATEVRLGAFNANLFVDFLMNSLIPALDGPRTIVMDNVPFHKHVRVGEVLEEAGHTVLRLPPYTPHLNATEYVFGNVKPYV